MLLCPTALVSVSKFRRTYDIATSPPFSPLSKPCLASFSTTSARTDYPSLYTASVVSWLAFALHCQALYWGSGPIPSGTAMLGQPVTKPEQAPELHPLAKIRLISKGSLGPRIRY